MENNKNKISLRKNQSFGFGSRLRIGKVLAPYSARPRVVPLIKHAKLMWFSKCYFFPKKKTNNTKKKQKYFLNFLGPKRIDLGPMYCH